MSNPFAGILAGGAVAALVLAAGAEIPLAGKVSAAPANPHISMQAARATALARLPGATISSEGLGLEGGVQLYSFDLQMPGRPDVEAVQIDAETGRLVSWRHNGAAAGRDTAADYQQVIPEPARR
jgi:uncharacterized membrane protein YkoI